MQSICFKSSIIAALLGHTGAVNSCSGMVHLSTSDLPSDSYGDIPNNKAAPSTVDLKDAAGVTFTVSWSSHSPSTKGSHYLGCAGGRGKVKNTGPGYNIYLAETSQESKTAPTLKRVAYFNPRRHDLFVTEHSTPEFEAANQDNWEQSNVDQGSETVAFEGQAVYGNILILQSVCRGSDDYSPSGNHYSSGQHDSQNVRRPMLYVFDLNDPSNDLSQGIDASPVSLVPQLVVTYQAGWEAALHVSMARHNNKIVAFATGGFQLIGKGAWIDIASFGGDASPDNDITESAETTHYSKDVFVVLPPNEVTFRTVTLCDDSTGFIPMAPESALQVPVRDASGQMNLVSLTGYVNYARGHRPYISWTQYLESADSTPHQGNLVVPHGGNLQFVSKYIKKDDDIYVVAANFMSKGSVELIKLGQNHETNALTFDLMSRFTVQSNAKTFTPPEGANRIVLFKANGRDFAAVPFKWGAVGVFSVDPLAQSRSDRLKLIHFRTVKGPMYALEVLPPNTASSEWSRNDGAHVWNSRDRNTSSVIICAMTYANKPKKLVFAPKNPATKVTWLELDLETPQ